MISFTAVFKALEVVIKDSVTNYLKVNLETIKNLY